MWLLAIIAGVGNGTVRKGINLPICTFYVIFCSTRYYCTAWFHWNENQKHMFMDTLQRFTSSEFNPFVIIISVKTVAVAFASFRKTVAAECHFGRKKKNNVRVLLTNIFSLFRRVGCCQSSSELIECKCPPPWRNRDGTNLLKLEPKLV